MPGKTIKNNMAIHKNNMTILIICTLFAISFSFLIFKFNIISFYTLLSEIICIGLLISIFCFVWHAYPKNPREINSIGIGSLILIINSILFIYFYLKPDFVFSLPIAHTDLASIYKTTERFARALLLFISFTGIVQYKLNKWYMFIIIMLLSILTPAIIHIPPIFFTKFIFPYGIFFPRESIILKTIINILILGLLLFSICAAYGNLKYKKLPYLKHIFLGLLVMLADEICFTAGSLLTGYFFISGYLLKILSYYCLLKGILTYRLINVNTNLEEPLEEPLEKNAMDIFNIYCCGVAIFNKYLKLIFINHKLEKILECKLEKIYGLHIESLLRKFKIADLNIIPTISLIDTGIDYEDETDNKSYIISLVNCNNEKIILSVKYYYMSNDTFLLTLTHYNSFHNLVGIDKQTSHILNSINNFVIISDKNNKVIFCNISFRNATGLNPSKVIGMTVKELCRLLNLRFNKTTSLGKKYINSRFKTREVTLNTLDGQKKHFVLQFTHIKGSENINNGYIITGSDITLLKQQQQDIRHQEKLAIMGQLGSGIVHEAKNMLASIKGYCQLLHLKSDNEYVKSTAKKIDDITSEINKIVMEFLTLSKPTPQNFKAVFLNSIISSIKYMLESPSFINEVKVKFNLTEHEKPIYADELQIKQVILNMSKNAIEAMDCTVSPTLEISTALSDSCKYMVLTIRDNGKGLNKEDLGKIGTPFYTTKEHGTGLGLNTCYKIIEEHRGKIEVESEIGKGTKFSIFLPCKSFYEAKKSPIHISLK
jgi:PAS domain S-box-containing protein